MLISMTLLFELNKSIEILIVVQISIIKLFQYQPTARFLQLQKRNEQKWRRGVHCALVFAALWIIATSERGCRCSNAIAKTTSDCNAAVAGSGQQRRRRCQIAKQEAQERRAPTFADSLTKAHASSAIRETLKFLLAKAPASLQSLMLSQSTEHSTGVAALNASVQKHSRASVAEVQRTRCRIAEYR